MINAKVTVEFTLKNVCSEEDLKDTKMSFGEMIKDLIQTEGLFGLVEPRYKVVDIVKTRRNK